MEMIRDISRFCLTHSQKLLKLVLKITLGVSSPSISYSVVSPCSACLRKRSSKVTGETHWQNTDSTLNCRLTSMDRFTQDMKIKSGWLTWGLFLPKGA